MFGQYVPQLIDTHAHIDDERLQEDIASVLQSARASNIVALVLASISRNRWKGVKNLCDEHADLFACYGLHPCFCDEHQAGDIDALASWIASERPVAVGECGLDYRKESPDRQLQQPLFAAQLALAREFSLPVVVHAHRAVDDVIRMIRASGHQRGLVHSFNGSLQQAYRLIDLGFKLGFGGAATYPRAHRLRTMLKALPLDALVFETDAPYQPDVLHHRQRNEPSYLRDIWRNLSGLRDESEEEIAHATSQTAIRLFDLPLKLDDDGRLQTIVRR